MHDLSELYNVARMRRRCSADELRDELCASAPALATILVSDSRDWLVHTASVSVVNVCVLVASHTNIIYKTVRPSTF